MISIQTFMHSLRYQAKSVWLLVLTAIILMGVFLGIRCFVDYRREVRLAEERLMTQARVVDENLNTNLSTISLILENIREELNRSPVNHLGLTRYLKIQADMTHGIRTLLITDSHGHCIYSNRDILVGQDFSDRDYFITARDSNDKSLALMSPPFRTVLGKFVINITKPVIGKGGDFNGIITISLDPEYFLTLLKSTIHASDNRIGLVHSDGIVFIAVPNIKGAVIGKNITKPGSNFLRHMHGGRKDSIQIGRSQTTGDNRIVAYITNTPKDLRFDKYLIVAASRNIDAVLSTWKISVAIHLSLYLLLSLLVVVVTRKMIQRGSELTRLHETHASILASAGDGILGLDQKGNILFCNKSFEHLSGRNRVELIGNSFFRCCPCMESCHEIEKCSIYLTLKDGISRSASDCSLASTETAAFPIEYTVTPLREQNQIVGAVIVFRDVTERIRAEKERARNAEYNQAILDSIRVHVAILDSNGLTVSVNNAWKRLAETSLDGPTLRTGVGGNYLDMCRQCAAGDAGQAETVLEGISSVLNGSAASFECEYPCHSGEIQRWFFMSVEPLLTQDGGAVVTHVDITKRKQVEEELQLSEKRFRHMFHDHGAVMLLIAPDTGSIVDANLAAVRFYGYSRETLLKKNIAEINTLSLEEIKTEMRLAQDQQRNFFSFNHSLANGSIRTVEVYSSPITLQDKALLFSIIHDVSDRKLAEKAVRDLEQQLFQAQKLESLVRMSGGVAHDFNNLLQVVVGNLDLSLMKLPQDASARRYIGEGLRAAEQAARLSKLMLEYSGKGYLFTKKLNLTKLVEEIAPMLTSAVPWSIGFEFRLEQAIPKVMADAEKLQEVIINMVENAVEAIGDDDGTITLSTGVRHFDQAHLNATRFEESLEEGQYVWLDVRDTGCGMDGDTQYKLFDPFFTTKVIGRGLGISAAYGIIRAHKGSFLVESKPGHGTSIMFLLPVSEDD